MNLLENNNNNKNNWAARGPPVLFQIIWSYFHHQFLQPSTFWKDVVIYRKFQIGRFHSHINAHQIDKTKYFRQIIRIGGGMPKQRPTPYKNE